MAAPPLYNTLRETDLGILDGPVDGAALRNVFKRYFSQTNAGRDAISKSLAKGLTPEANFRCETLTAFVAHAVPFTVRLKTLKRVSGGFIVGFDTALPWPIPGLQMLQPSQSGGVPTVQVTVWFNSPAGVGNVRLWLFEDGLQMTTAPAFSPLLFATASITPAAVPAASCADQTFAVAGLGVTHRISAITPPAALGNVSVHGYPSAANTLLLHFTNPTAGPVTPPAGIYSFAAFR